MLPQQSVPVSYVHVDGLGGALAVVELANSSDQTSVPDAMLGVNALVATAEFVSPYADSIYGCIRADLAPGIDQAELALRAFDNDQET